MPSLSTHTKERMKKKRKRKKKREKEIKVSVHSNHRDHILRKNIAILKLIL